MAADRSEDPILLYDGVCALCNGAVRFVLKRDRAGIFRFAPLQGDLAGATLARHGRDPDALSTLVVVVDPGGRSERLLDRSTAVLFVLSRLPGAWPAIARVLRWIPRPVRDAVYNGVARVRYRTFGKYDVCPVPPPGVRERFL